jgi:long-chain fatty acid transport protein
VENLVLEAGIRWEGWSSYNELKIELDQAVNGSKVSTIPKNWDDTFAFLFGGEYRLNDMAVLRAGYLKSGTPVPDYTFEPSIPDADTDIWTVGTGIKYNQCRIDLAYAFQKVHDRHKSNLIDDNATDELSPNPATSANGRYGTEMHMLGVSVSHTF